MFLKYLCPACNRYFELGDDISSNEARCPDCGGEVRISKAKFIGVPKNQASTIDFQVILVGYLLSIIVPVVGFVLGIYFLFKNEIQHGVLCMLISLVGGGLWAIALHVLKFI
jgi:DNA-directed RNA polymerase subunit RPC12/RpoP